jgi:hypothetical protein
VSSQSADIVLTPVADGRKSGSTIVQSVLSVDCRRPEGSSGAGQSHARPFVPLVFPPCPHGKEEPVPAKTRTESRIERAV